MRVQDPLGEAGGARRVVELGRVVGQRVLGLEAVVAARGEVLDQQDVLDQPGSMRPALAASVTSTFAAESRTRWRIPSSP